jgi:hypothetical protein
VLGWLTRRDVGAGLLFAAIGGVGLVLGADLPVGTARRMGPGYMPYGLCLALIALGALVTLRGSRGPQGSVEAMRLRPFLGLMAGGTSFALLIESAGIILATVGAVLGAAIADRSSRWIEVVLLAVLAVAFCTIVFGLLLDVRAPIWFR